MKRSNSYQGFIAIVFTLALLYPLSTFVSRAQEPTPAPTPATQSINKAELHQALVDLGNTWTVMCVAAHPDDEDGTTLTVLRRRDGVHTVSLFSTYGEGGQNAVGPELYEELGVIRAHETMNAAKIQGSEPHFLGLRDFGFSKSADEAFKVWGHDEALKRMVLKIRELRPDVIITNHDTTSGHGHHQATGRLIIEAFDAAADPQRFPEQLGQVRPWQAQRLFVRVFGGNAQVAATDKIFAVDPNEVDPVRGTSFAEQALAALQQHATQGPWPKSLADMMRARRIEGGKLPLIRYRLIREAKDVPTLTANANTPLAGLVLPATFATATEPPKIDGKPLTESLDRPDKVLAALVDWRAALQSSVSHNIDGVSGTPQATLEQAVADPRFALFEARANHALAVAAGVSLSLSSSAPVLVPGVPTTFSINIANAGIEGIHVNDLRFNGWNETQRLSTAEALLPDTETVVSVDGTTPQNAPLSVPQEEHLYDGLFLGKRVEATVALEIDGAKFSVDTETLLEVAPAIEITKVSPAQVVWSPGRNNQPLKFTTLVRNNLKTPFHGVLELNSGVLGISAVGSSITLEANETREVPLQSNAGLMARARKLRSSRENSNYAALTVKDSAATVISKRTLPVVFTDAQVARGLRVGYVPSFDQTLEHSLDALGVNSKALTVDDIKSADLSSYSTIIIDNRGYEAHPELIAANSRLLEFAQAGGTLIIFYHKDNEWNPDEKRHRPQLAPYPIILDDKRVTDETAPISFLQPRHAMLNLPNKITAADFANWIQERGLYYPKDWDPHYTALFETNDPGEAPLKGGLLVAQYGKGNYIYTSMVWYRELRAGVPGAYRMFANMISYGHK
jgi:LmbE family N-acetylglucosaminyl deacetylase